MRGNSQQVQQRAFHVEIDRKTMIWCWQRNSSAALNEALGAGVGVFNNGIIDDWKVGHESFIGP
jgi:hypothetical protein